MSNYDVERKIWSNNNDRPSIYNPKTSLGDIVLYALDRTPDKICEISDDYGSFLTCFEVRNRSIYVAENLKNQHGVKFGDVCAVISMNNPEVSSVVFGCLFLGASLNTLDPSFDQHDMDHMLGLTRPKVIFVEISVLETIKKSLEKLRLVSKIFCFTSQEGTVPNGIERVKTLLDPSQVSVDLEKYLPVRIPDTTKHIAFILCSSGTTGLSKGVCVPHAQMVSQLLRFWPVDSNDITFAFSSLYWISGVIVLFRGVVEGAIRITTCKPFTPSYFFDLVEKHKVTHVFLGPYLIAQCLESKEIHKSRLTSIRLCVAGGSFVFEELRSKFEKYLGEGGKVLLMYGMSEIACACTYSFEAKPGSVGGVVNEHQIKILSDKGELLGPNEKGEISVLSPFPFLGYYGNEDENRKLRNLGGWFPSGDLGYFDEDGFLFIIGRKKEIIKYGNHQIPPSAIETIIQEKTGLTQVCAVPIEDHRLGTDLPAVMIVRPPDFPLTEKEIVEILDESLNDIKKLRGGVYFAEKLPMTPSGKIQRRLVKKLVNDLYVKSKK